MVIKTVFRYEKREKVFRVFRVLFANRTRKFSIAFTPKVFEYSKDISGTYIVLCCCRIHFAVTYSGKFC